MRSRIRPEVAHSVSAGRTQEANAHNINGKVLASVENCFMPGNTFTMQS
ncbi:MAG: hypothetical protein R3B54_00205 [Bdellovibrionota bacterium]